MAWTARSDAETTEFFDDQETLDWKVTALAALIRKSKHFTVFTGAGISTSAGIPDFRSGLNTVLDTGAGKWAKDAAIKQGIDVTPKKKLIRKSTLQAIPTPTHMALVELNNKAILKYLISQNCDGLHRRSGYNPTNISELHGNTNLEFCRTCGKQYLRDYSVRNRYNHVHTHTTLRSCTNKDKDGNTCGKLLEDTIINFGESLNSYAWDPAEDNAERSDFCLVLGSSLTVTPACDLPEHVGKHNGFCIVNLQKTPMDNLCDIRIFAKTDDVMKVLMNKLGLKIPEWRLRRYIDIDMDFKENIMSIYGVDYDGTPYDILSMIKLKVNKKVYTKSGACLPGKLFTKCNLDSIDKETDIIRIELGFMARYCEPNLIMDLMQYVVFNNGKPKNKQKFRLNLVYNPYNGIWDIVKDKSGDDDEDDNNMLVFGYIGDVIPPNIKHLCYKYWKPMDEWSTKYMISSRIGIERHCDLKVLSDAMTTVFNEKVAFQNLRYLWKLRMMKYMNNGTRKSRGKLIVGIVPFSVKKLKLLKFSTDWEQEKEENWIPYCYDITKEKISDNDIIDVYLDLLNGRMSIVINGKSNKERMFQIQNKNYKLAIGIRNCKGTEIQLF